ncbi:hypothetical protein DAPPUDRAFT_49296 [Daphnia pulex]|uniref:Carbohydrate sulfotransferase n=1 Tax=Daphnia pulex TaxID=6669 RepID=E9GEK3_DAPPU|nr:hypothetical protein DAPPUDRAFT_49296 [Daphnia pulex]|eukprot:EFX82280.1 hypothetical protein DAPPUDRAFT_49296 [Daphnia pulex]
MLTTVAANNNQTKRIAPVRFRVEDRHRVLFCFVPKVASRNLVRLMLILARAVETNDLSAVPKPKVFAENPMRILYAKTLNDTVKNGAGDFFKFLFVRHPFERLVSAYQDKLGINDPIYHKMVGKVIVRKVRKNPSRLSLEMGNDVTFPEFVTFIIDEWRNGENPLDIHWRPIFDLCLPCEMQFDFIGKFETLNRDVDFLLRKLNETDLVGLFTGQPKAQTTSSLWKESMNQISHQQLSELNRIYADDFRLFGYPYYYNGKESLH